MILLRPLALFSFLLMISTTSIALAKTLPTALDDIERVRIDVPKQTSAAMHGETALQQHWQHLEYVNPKAPKGGTLKLPSIGTFDSLNQFISKGAAADGLELVYDTLTSTNLDEPFSVYGLLAKSFQIAPDNSWIVFQLNPLAKFHDGHTVDSDDVVFTFKTLIEQGAPLFQLQFLEVEDAVALNKHEVAFRFKTTTNKELPLIIGQLPILPKHYWKDREFDTPTLDKPLGSGPYQVADFKTGKTITYERVENDWAQDHPLRVGRYNFQYWVQEYFSEANIALEAFKTGEYTLRPENNSKFWATSYTGPAIDANKIIKQEIPVHSPVGMQGFVYNLRKPVFQDPILREALAYAFNFDWSNDNLFYGQYKRSRSYFDNTELAATGLPSAAELKLLQPLKQQLPTRVFTQEYQPPSTKGLKNIRPNLRIAKKMLQKAGYTLDNKQLMNPQGKPVKFEFLLYDTGFERIVLPFIKHLKVLGVTVEPRRVDVNQYVERLREYNYDMIVSSFPQSLSPGNEQRNYWHSSAVKQRNSRNLTGIADPAIDSLIETVVKAQSRDDLVTASHALDRALQWQFLVIPNWHVSYERIAYWPPVTMPKQHPQYAVDLTSWWFEK